MIWWKKFREKIKQAGTELGQAQLKLEFDLTLIFSNFPINTVLIRLEIAELASD